MTEPKFTPGPWEADASAPGDVVVWAGEELVANIGQRVQVCVAFDVDEANAHLIAAAPDLYEALGSLLDVYSRPDQSICCSGQDCGCQGSTIYQEAEYYARAALAKARGES